MVFGILIHLSVGIWIWKNIEIEDHDSYSSIFKSFKLYSFTHYQTKSFLFIILGKEIKMLNQDVWKKIGGKEVAIDFLPGVLE